MVLAIWKPGAMAGPADAPKRQTIGKKRLPLIILSHGTGAGPMAHVDTAEALAGAGFVVAAPLHRGDNFQDQSNVGRRQWMASRSSDVSDVIDYMLTAWTGHAAIDPARIGIFGFSAGGTTALVAIGGVPDPKRLEAHCRDKREFVCNLMLPESADPATSPEWKHDSRIAAAVVAAPGLGFAFEPQGLSKVRVPVQLWSGAEDETVPYATNAAVVKRLLPRPPEFHSVDGAVHLSFLAPADGDLLVVEATALRHGKRTSFAEARLRVGDRLVATGEFAFHRVPDAAGR